MRFSLSWYSGRSLVLSLSSKVKVGKDNCWGGGYPWSCLLTVKSECRCRQRCCVSSLIQDQPRLLDRGIYWPSAWSRSSHAFTISIAGFYSIFEYMDTVSKVNILSHFGRCRKISLSLEVWLSFTHEGKNRWIGPCSWDDKEGSQDTTIATKSRNLLRKICLKSQKIWTPHLQ